MTLKSVILKLGAALVLLLLHSAANAQAGVTWVADTPIVSSSLTAAAVGTFNSGSASSTATGLNDEYGSLWNVSASGFLTTLTNATTGTFTQTSTNGCIAKFSGSGATSNGLATFNTDASGHIIASSVTVTNTGAGFTAAPVTISYTLADTTTVITPTTAPTWSFGMYTANVIHSTLSAASRYTGQLVKATGTTLNQRVVVYFIANTTAGNTDVVMRYNRTSRTGTGSSSVGMLDYLAEENAGAAAGLLEGFSVNSVTATVIAPTTSPMPAIVPGHLYASDAAAVTAAASTILYEKFYDLGPVDQVTTTSLSGLTPIASYTSNTDTTTGLTTAGQIGISSINGTRSYVVELDTFTATGVSTVGMSVVDASSAGASISLSWASASGGTAPYTYAVYRSTASAFTTGAGNVLTTGLAALTYTDTPPVTGTVYYYKVIVTDAVPNTSTGNQVSGVAASGLAYKVAFFGDSRVAGTGAINLSDATDFPAASKGISLALQVGLNGLKNPFAYVTVWNEGVSGVTSAYWTATNITNALAAANTVTGASVAFGTVDTRSYAILEIGANDAKVGTATANATYITRVTATINALITAGFVKIFVTTTYGTSPLDATWDEAAQGLISGYNGDLQSAINASSTPAKVSLIDPGTYAFYAARARMFYNDAHLNDMGYTAWAELLVKPIGTGMGLIAAGSGGGAGRRVQ